MSQERRINYFIEMLETATFTDDERMCVEETINTLKTEYAQGFDHNDLSSAQSKLQIIWALLPDFLSVIKYTEERK